jgi:hypothetical protein
MFDECATGMGQRLAVRGRGLEGRVTAKRGWILGDDDETMHTHWELSATTKTAPFRRNPLGAGGGGPQALSLVGHDEKMATAASVIDLGGRSSLRACNPKTPARGPRDFCHGLLGEDGQQSDNRLSIPNTSVLDHLKGLISGGQGNFNRFVFVEILLS